MFKALSARVECPNCGTSHIVDRDGDGFPDLDLVPCQGSDTCASRLCKDCRYQCDACGEYACEHHVGNEKIICHACIEENTKLMEAWLGDSE